ncbi:hypothetical protein HPB50_009555 [Hyalomma asiaticum]|uniref:Uncharacterized protein n=1 Tax=Hyalomma asiaticum TaxID=266040 RepID=A0ACB7TFS0_HYAAI|nr:hypothetical protein HPB50_009555 [Hyalomma asiaticum]
MVARPGIASAKIEQERDLGAYTVSRAKGVAAVSGRPASSLSYTGRCARKQAEEEKVYDNPGPDDAGRGCNLHYLPVPRRSKDGRRVAANHFLRIQ